MQHVISRRRALALVATMGVGLAVVACGGAAGSATAPAATSATGTTTAPSSRATASTAASSSAASQTPATGAAASRTPATGAAGKIVFTHWLIGGTPGIAAFDKLVALFQQQQRAIQVDNETPTGNYWEVIQTRLAGGDAPDVMAIDNYDITALAAKGGAMPLESLIASSKYDLGTFYPIALLEGIYNGKRYGLPYIGSTRVMGYNADLFSKAGLPTPAERWDKGEWTWDTFLQSAQRLTIKDSSGKVQQFGYLADSPLWWMAHWIFANGGPILNAEHTTCLLDDPKTVDAVSFVQSLISKYHVSPTAAETKDVNLQANGRVAMWDDWRGNVTNERTFKYQWDVAPPPMVAATGKTSFYKGNSMVVYSHTKQVDAAWQFAQFICGPEANKEFVNLGGASPVSVPEVRDVFLNSTPPRNNRYYLDPLSQNYAVLLPLNPHWPELETKADAGLQNLLQSNQNPKDALGALVPQINQILGSPVS